MTDRLKAIMDFEPTPCREWTRWDHLVHKITGRVSRRVYEDRMANMMVDDYRMAELRVGLARDQKEAS